MLSVMREENGVVILMALKTKYNPQNEMFVIIRTKRHFP